MRMNFQDPATEVMEGIIELHHTVMFYLIVILTLVAWMLLGIIKEFGMNYYLGNTSVDKMLQSRKAVFDIIDVYHGRTIEIIWTIVPTLVLVCIAVPSFALLYDMEAVVEPTITIKAIGHQWYWSYEYSDYVDSDLKFDSYMIPEEDLNEGQFRLLEVDRKVWLPINTHVRVVITAADVLHCWAVPALGIKLDAVPGRLNQVMLFLKREGVFYGQCSELCGVNHGFMPIAVKAVPMSLYNYWVDFHINGESV